jgi:hypothetical protein
MALTNFKKEPKNLLNMLKRLPRGSFFSSRAFLKVGENSSMIKSTSEVALDSPSKRSLRNTFMAEAICIGNRMRQQLWR